MKISFVFVLGNNNSIRNGLSQMELKSHENAYNNENITCTVRQYFASKPCELRNYTIKGQCVNRRKKTIFCENNLLLRKCRTGIKWAIG